MNELKVFNNEEFGDIRTVMIDGKPWFVGKDIAAALGYQNPQEAIRDHVDNDDKKMGEKNATPSVIDNLGRIQYPSWINESGLYSLILSSKLPSAMKFKHWVTSEVLPSIRKHGVYMTTEKMEEMLGDPNAWIAMLNALKEEREAKGQLLLEMKQNESKVLFADVVSASRDCILVGDFVKSLAKNGINIGQNRFFEWLRNHGYLIKANRQDCNMLTQKSMDLGVFEVDESCYKDPGGEVHIWRTPKVTPKGQIYFISKFLEEANGSGETI